MRIVAATRARATRLGRGLIAAVCVFSGCATKNANVPDENSPKSHFSFSDCTATAGLQVTYVRCEELTLSILHSPHVPDEREYSAKLAVEGFAETATSFGATEHVVGTKRIHQITFQSGHAEGSGRSYHWLAGESPNFIAGAVCTSPPGMEANCEAAVLMAMEKGIPHEIITPAMLPDARPACEQREKSDIFNKFRCRVATVFLFHDVRHELSKPAELIEATLEDAEAHGRFYAAGRMWPLWRSVGKQGTYFLGTAAEMADGDLHGFACNARETMPEWVCILLLTRAITWGAEAFAEKSRQFTFDLNPPSAWIPLTPAELEAVQASPRGRFFERMQTKGVWKHRPSQTTIFVAYNDHFDARAPVVAFRSLLRPLRSDAAKRGLKISTTDLEPWPASVNGHGLWIDERFLRAIMRLENNGVLIESTILVGRTGFITVLAFGPSTSWPKSDVLQFYRSLRVPADETRFDRPDAPTVKDK